MQRYRTPETVKKRIDIMARKGKVILDHGVSSYEFDHYEYEQNGLQSKLHIYYKDFDANKTVRHYMTLTADNLRNPKEVGYTDELVHCSWEKEYPTLLNMREYYR